MGTFTQHTRLLLLAVGLLCLASCAVSTKDTIAIGQPVSSQVEDTIRGVLGQEEEVVRVESDTLPRYVAIVPFENTTEEAEAPTVLRRTLQNHIATKNYQVMHWREVDLQVAEMDAAMLQDTRRLASALGVDGIVRGKITHYEFFFAGIYAHIKLGMDLSLENEQGESLWSDQLEVTTRAGGISTSPWGLLLNAALAAMHLSEKNLLATADELGREIAVAFPEPIGFQGMAGPLIENVIHDAVNKTLRYGDSLTIGVKGEPGQRAIASIEGIGSFDLQEQEPGAYISKIPVSTEWNVSNREVVGRLINGAGKATRFVSPVGLVNIDNMAPGQVAALSLKAHSGNAYVKWQAPADADVAGYRVYQLEGDQRDLLREVAEPDLTLPDIAVFQRLNLEVTALDRVGNESVGVVAAARAYPIPGAADAAIAGSKLGGDISSGLLLTAANSPYLLATPLVVEAGAALYVEPGVVINTAPGGNMFIKGEAYFWGDAQPIRFYPAQESKVPAHFLLIDSSESVSVHGVVFERGGVAVDIRSGSADLRAVKFINSEYSAMSITGAASPTVSDCVVEGSNTSGVVIENHAKPVFSGCSFARNQPFHMQSTSIYEVRAEGNKWQPAASTSTVLGKVRY